MSKIHVPNTLLNESGRTSFEERSAWIQLAGLSISFAGYLFIASRMLASGVRALSAFAAVLAVSVVLLIVILVAGYIVAAATGRTDDRDERDRLIDWRAEARSGWLLASGVIVGLGCMVAGVPNVWTANLLLASLYFAELLRLTLQVVSYRRGF
jgi:nitrate reductase gamma subunit